MGEDEPYWYDDEYDDESENEEADRSRQRAFVGVGEPPPSRSSPKLTSTPHRSPSPSTEM